MEQTLSNHVSCLNFLGWVQFQTFYPHLGFPGGSAGKESACDAGDLSSILGLGRSPGEGDSYPLQYSGLENSMDVHSMELQRVRHDS